MQCTRGYAENYAMHPYLNFSTSTSSFSSFTRTRDLAMNSLNRSPRPPMVFKGLGCVNACPSMERFPAHPGSADSGSLVTAGRYRFSHPLSEATRSNTELSLSPLSHPHSALTQLSYPPTFISDLYPASFLSNLYPPASASCTFLSRIISPQ